MKPLLTATALLIVLGGAAYAKGPARAFDFDAIDADGNGEITQAEIDAAQAARFAAADTDSDGSLSVEELSVAMENWRSERAARASERILSRLDENEDGSLSAEELAGGDRSARMFERLDKDDSGTISAEEAEAMKDRRRGGRHGKGGRDGKKRGGQRGGDNG